MTFLQLFSVSLHLLLAFNNIVNKGSGRCFCFRQLVWSLAFLLGDIDVPEGSEWLIAEPEGSEWLIAEPEGSELLIADPEGSKWLTVEGFIWLAKVPEDCECLREGPDASLWRFGGPDVSG